MSVWKRIEREFNSRLSEATGQECVRPGHEEARSGNIGDSINPFPLCVQIRSGYHVSYEKALADAEMAAEGGELPVGAMYVRPKQPGVAGRRRIVMDWETFFRMAEALTRCNGWEHV